MKMNREHPGSEGYLWLEMLQAQLRQHGGGQAEEREPLGRACLHKQFTRHHQLTPSQPDSTAPPTGVATFQVTSFGVGCQHTCMCALICSPAAEITAAAAAAAAAEAACATAATASVQAITAAQLGRQVAVVLAVWEGASLGSHPPQWPCSWVQRMAS